MKEIREFNAIRQMNDALNTRNESFIILIHDLSLNSSTLMFREENTDQSNSWKRLFKLLSIQSESAILELSNESTKFQSISIKSYYQNDYTVENQNFSSSSTSNLSSLIEPQNDFATNSIIRISIHQEILESIKRDREQSRKYSISIACLNFVLNSTVVSQFTAFKQQKIAELLEKEIFFSVNKTEMLSDVRMFNSRFVDEIKHSNTEKAFEKSRLVIEVFKNQN